MAKKITVKVPEKLHKKFKTSVYKKKSNISKRITELIKADLAV